MAAKTSRRRQVRGWAKDNICSLPRAGARLGRSKTVSLGLIIGPDGVTMAVCREMPLHDFTGWIVIEDTFAIFRGVPAERLLAPSVAPSLLGLALKAGTSSPRR